MSKFNKRIYELALSISKRFDIPEKELKYASQPLKEAIDAGHLVADIVFQMQHLAMAFGCYIDSYIVFDISDPDISELYDTYESEHVTKKQKQVVIDYYQDHHPKLKQATEQLDSFLLYCAVRSALFNWKESSNSRLAYATMTIALDESIVVIDQVVTTMASLQSPNRMLHIAVDHHLPQQIQDIEIMPNESQTL